MTPDQVKRKLAAILSADVKGYSKLMGDDEEWTLRTLNTYKGLIRNLVGEHRGRVVGGAGDSILAEFASVVDAVECAVEIQQVLKAKNAILPETRKMDFRIGINLGDVMEEEDSIYGDGVNIAARLEGLAEPGGICISGTAYDQIENKIPLHYDFLGEHEVKNIAKPIRVYRAIIEPRATSLQSDMNKKQVWMGLSKWAIGLTAVVVITVAGAIYQFALRPSLSKTEVASKEKMAYPLPDVPSIAVLPFVNMSGDPKQEFLCDGMTEEIISALSKVPNFVVIARNSTFKYKGKPVDVKRVSEDLGVRYVLEGSMQRSGDRIRLNAQLIDALTGHHLWAEHYDRDLKDIFALQDEITIEILNGVQVKLTMGGKIETIEKYFKGKQGLDCYMKLMEAGGYLNRWNIESNNLARRISEEAVAMCPDNPISYVFLGGVYQQEIWLGNTKSPKESIEKGVALAQKALTIDESIYGAHSLLCWLNIFKREHDKAITEGERAVALNPGSTLALDPYANALRFAGRAIEAIPVFQKAIRLNPFGPSSLFVNYGLALRDVGRFKEAVSALKKAIQIEPDHFFAHLGLVMTYIMMEQEKEARAEVAEVLRINPKFSVDSLVKVMPYKDQSQTEKLISALRKAGLK
jgi:adenylate cyclase